MRSTDLSQVVVRPAEATPELLAAIVAAIDRQEEGPVSRASKVRIWLADVLHPIGIHHWVNYNTYDPASDRIIVWPGRWICSKCPRGRTG